MYFVIKI